MNTYKDHLEFFEKNGNIKFQYENVPEKFDYDWVMYQSRWPWLELDLDIPHEEMFKEALALKDRFVLHRWNDQSRGYFHHNWKSISIHGIDSQKTENFHAYGYKSQEEAPYNWTEIADQCPVTINFLKTLPFAKKNRIRFMLLEPGGYIHPHRDQEDFSFYPINIALNNPQGCRFAMEGKGVLPFRPGKGFMMNLAYTHCVFNDSNEPRIHMIIHASAEEYIEQHKILVEKSFNKLKEKLNNGLIV